MLDCAAALWHQTRGGAVRVGSQDHPSLRTRSGRSGTSRLGATLPGAMGAGRSPPTWWTRSPRPPGVPVGARRTVSGSRTCIRSRWRRPRTVPAARTRAHVSAAPCLPRFEQDHWRTGRPLPFAPEPACQPRGNASKGRNRTCDGITALFGCDAVAPHGVWPSRPSCLNGVPGERSSCAMPIVGNWPVCPACGPWQRKCLAIYVDGLSRIRRGRRSR